MPLLSLLVGLLFWLLTPLVLPPFTGKKPQAPLQRKVTLYTPHRGQIRIHKSKARFRVIACGRRFGKTLMACNEIVKFALDHPNANCAWVAPWFRQSKIAYRFIRRALAKSDRIIVHKSDSDLRLEFANGSVIQFFSAENHDAIRGDGYHFMVIDEAGDALRDPKVWTDSIRASLSDTNGRALIIGTPKGRNLFFQLFNRGDDPKYPEWASFHAATGDNPYILKSEIAAAKQELPEDAYEQEYCARFLEYGAGVFKGVDACIKGLLDAAYQPVAGHRYVLGFDPAKYKDFSVITLIDCNTRRVVGWQRINQIDYTVQLAMVAAVAQKFRAFVLMDMTGVGDPLLEQLKLKRGFASDGYLFTHASKKALIENLQLGIQNRDIEFPDIPVLVGELRQFEYQLTPGRQLTYSAPKGAHDDAVISLALAYYAMHTPGAMSAEGYLAYMREYNALGGKQQLSSEESEEDVDGTEESGRQKRRGPTRQETSPVSRKREKQFHGRRRLLAGDTAAALHPLWTRRSTQLAIHARHEPHQLPALKRTEQLRHAA